MLMSSHGIMEVFLSVYVCMYCVCMCVRVSEVLLFNFVCVCVCVCVCVGHRVMLLYLFIQRHKTVLFGI